MRHRNLAARKCRSCRDRRRVVAKVASRLFGSTVDPANMATETLQRVTFGESQLSPDALRRAISRSAPAPDYYQPSPVRKGKVNQTGGKLWKALAKRLAPRLGDSRARKLRAQELRRSIYFVDHRRVDKGLFDGMIEIEKDQRWVS